MLIKKTLKESMAMIAITFSKELLEKLRASLPTALKSKNIQAYRMAMALIWYDEGRGINEIAKLLGVRAC